MFYVCRSYLHCTASNTRYFIVQDHTPRTPPLQPSSIYHPVLIQAANSTEGSISAIIVPSAWDGSSHQRAHESSDLRCAPFTSQTDRPRQDPEAEECGGCRRSERRWTLARGRRMVSIFQNTSEATWLMTEEARCTEFLSDVT